MTVETLIVCWTGLFLYALFDAVCVIYPDLLLNLGYWLRERGEALRQYGRRIKLRR